MFFVMPEATQEKGGERWGGFHENQREIYRGEQDREARSAGE